MKTLNIRFAASFLAAALLLQPFQPVLSARADPIPSPDIPASSLVSETTPLAAMYNTNLVPDGDAEIVPYTNYWVDNEGWTQILPYGQDCGGICDYPDPYDPGPAQRGKNFFYEGTTSNHTNSTNMWLKNKISLAPIQTAINTGKIRYILSGYFGGDGTNTVTSQLHMFFETSTGASKGEAIVGNVTPAQRNYQTGLLYREVRGYIPAGTQFINLDLQTGNINMSPTRTGYADNLSLILLPFQQFLPVLTNAPKQAPPQTGFPAPTGVYVTHNGLTRMDIYWTDNSANELGFLVQRINADASVDTICNTGPNVTYCLDPGLSAAAPYGYVFLGSNKTYTYQVRAIGPGINSAWPNGTGTTATMPTAAPSPTRGAFTCQAIDTGSTSTTFVWNDPFNYEAGFNLYKNSSSTPSYSMIEGGTKISFIDLTPGDVMTLRIVPFVYQANPVYVTESATSCTVTVYLDLAQSSGVTKFSNDASYPVISLIVDGMEQFPVRPLAILTGGYYELDGVPAGSHQWTAITGFWDDWGRRFAMYNYTGSYTQPASGTYEVHIPDMSINDLLSVPPANIGYWEGYYFDSGINCHTAAFKFMQNGTYKFYVGNSQTGSGTYSLYSRQPAIFSTKFSLSGLSGVQALLVETQGEFYLKNGPASWQQITYVFKPQGYVYNAFCP